MKTSNAWSATRLLKTLREEVRSILTDDECARKYNAASVRHGLGAWAQMPVLDDSVRVRLETMSARLSEYCTAEHLAETEGGE